MLGYLLKHAHLALEQRAQAALADLGVTARDLGVLRVIAGGEARSQQEVAEVLGVDRTSMVALLDALERQGIITRRPSRTRPATQHRRAHRPRLGKGFRQAESRSSETEREFTAALGDAGAAGLRQALRTVLGETATPEQAPGQVFIKKRQVTHPYGVSPHGPPTSHEIPINDLGRAGRAGEFPDDLREPAGGPVE